MTPADQQIAFIGAGNVATHMAKALRNAGMKIKAVYSHTLVSAQTLAAEVEADAINDIADLPEANIFVYCVKDDVLPKIAAINSLRFPNALHIHTSGSTPANVFLNQWHGVIYPMQTFSKNAALNFSEVRCYIEGSNRQSLKMIDNLTRSLTSHVSELDTEARLCLHAAAVFACNFANHCFALAEKLLKEKGIAVYRAYVGNYFTSLDMMGATLTLMKLDEELKELLDMPVNTVGLKQKGKEKG